LLLLNGLTAHIIAYPYPDFVRIALSIPAVDLLGIQEQLFIKLIYRKLFFPVLWPETLILYESYFPGYFASYFTS